VASLRACRCWLPVWLPEPGTPRSAQTAKIITSTACLAGALAVDGSDSIASVRLGASRASSWSAIATASDRAGTSRTKLGARIAEYEFRSARSNAPSSARISAGSGGMVGGPPRPGFGTGDSAGSGPHARNFPRRLSVVRPRSGGVARLGRRMAVHRDSRSDRALQAAMNRPGGRCAGISG